jgi:hypothetical protein
MPFSKEYVPLIQTEEGVSKNLIRPRNIYKINSYTYKDGKTKSLAGVETSYIFVIGISPTKVISALKISLIKPKDFFRWLKKLYKPSLSENSINDSERLEDILILDNKDGRKIFNQFVAQSRIYNQNIPTYRTYIAKNIKNVELVNLKKEVLIQYIK